MVLEELTALGIPNLSLDEGGVAFTGEMEVLHRANLHLRIASRVLVRVADFRATAFHDLERNARKIPWGEFLPRNGLYNLRVTAKKSKLYHSDAIAQRLAESIERVTESRPSTADGSSQLFVVRMFHDRCVVSADSSGAHLHLRGYREAVGKAPMRETLAAALLHAAGWKGELTLLDPMCGSGTIPIEAALIARGIAPGIARASREPRAYAFERWPAHGASAWHSAVARAQESVRGSASVRIEASDRDQGAIESTLANADRAGVTDDLYVSRKAISSIEPAAETGVLICNPPYGKRVGDDKALRNLYASIGNLMRSSFAGWSVVMLSGNSVLDRHIGMEFDTVAGTTNGGLKVRIRKSSRLVE